MKHAVLTLDYELYGNGSGDVFKHVIEPTEAILKVLNEKNVKMTIFVEIVEFLRIKQEWDNGNNMGYSSNPYDAVVAQLQQAALDGHDIQLHIHPQWLEAKFLNGKWSVDYDMWRLGVYNGDMKELLSWAKVELETIVQEVIPNYHCVAFRAGGYNAQPSERIAKAMREVGLFIDSSMVPGAVERGALSHYDYSHLPVDKGYWFAQDCLDAPKEDGEIIEMPIVAFPVLRLRKYLSSERLKAIFQNRKSAFETYNAKTSEKGEREHRWGIWKKISYFFEYESQTWDYCLFTKSLHRLFMRKIEEQKDRNVVVLVGHPKSLINVEIIEYLLLQMLTNYSFTTLSKWASER